MPVGTILTAAAIGSRLVGGILGRRRRRREARRQERHLRQQRERMEQQRDFALERHDEQGRSFMAQSSLASTLAGVAGGAGTSTTLGLQESERRIAADRKQLETNFESQIAGLDQEIGQADRAGRVTAGDVFSFAADAFSAGSQIHGLGGFSGMFARGPSGQARQALRRGRRSARRQGRIQPGMGAMSQFELEANR